MLKWGSGCQASLCWLFCSVIYSKSLCLFPTCSLSQNCQLCTICLPCGTVGIICSKFTPYLFYPSLSVPQLIFFQLYIFYFCIMSSVCVSSLGILVCLGCNSLEQVVLPTAVALFLVINIIANNKRWLLPQIAFCLFVFLGGEENKKDYQTQTKNPTPTCSVIPCSWWQHVKI